MCGINGFTWEDKGLIARMVKATAHRGPDGHAVYTDKGISLGHNRLSIIDITERGKQPMKNEDGTVWLVFNGEIYNFRPLREELVKKGHRFMSETDSEVIIHSYEEYGHDCVKRFNGMFAFAIWDTQKKELFLARDRIGIKPLYYCFKEGDCSLGSTGKDPAAGSSGGQKLVFSSEIKAILQHEIVKEIDKESLNSFLTYRFIASDSTMIKGIKKLLPGHMLIFRKGGAAVKRYWSLGWKTEKNSIGYYTLKAEALLKDSVKKRLVADVPLGVFLSGGLDSSLITAINTRLREDPVKTFSVGFGHETDELGHARRVSEWLKTEHKEIVLDYRQLTNSLPEIVYHMDEPHTDPTMVPQYFLSRFARRRVTVVNTGEGADEVFSGYSHYRIGSDMFRPVPGFAKRAVYSRYYQPFKPGERERLLGEKPPADIAMKSCLLEKGHPLNRILDFDIRHELPNWQLSRVDRMTMAHGMEARVPFLDHRMVELGAKIPPQFKQRGLEGKHILKRMARTYLPRDIILRKKQGFTTPMDSWLRHDLLGLSESILSEGRSGLFRKEYVSRLVEKQKKSKGPRPFDRTSYQLLILSMFEMWHRMYIENNARLMKIDEF